MYRITKSTELYRDNPWSIPCEDRIEKLRNSKKLGQKTVAYLYPKFDSSTFRYRGFNVAETLEYSFYWTGTYFEFHDLTELTKNLKYVDVIVIIRCPWTKDMESFLASVKEEKIKLCYDVDDLIFNPKHMPSVIDALGLDQDSEWNYWYGLTQRNYMVAESCDALITTNDYLRNFLLKDFDKPCYTICNYLNWYQEKVSGEYFDQKQKIKTEDPFEIGYFSGSPTHVKDISLIMPEIEEFLIKHQDSVFKIVGYMNLPEKYQYLEKKERIVFVPFQSFVDLQYEQSKVDINVVPLVNNEFSNCKSELKYFESAIVGTLTCATPSFTYSNAIKSGYNGFICEVGEWYDAFEKIYDMKEMTGLQQTIRECALREYSGRSQLIHVEEVLNAIIDQA